MLKKYHFIAIGGIGMSGLAKYLLEDGHSVSGSDIVDSKYIDAIKKMGANVNIGHAESNLPNDTDTVVVSTAIRDTNPELQKAKKLCIQKKNLRKSRFFLFIIYTFILIFLELNQLFL